MGGAGEPVMPPLDKVNCLPLCSHREQQRLELGQARSPFILTCSLKPEAAAPLPAHEYRLGGSEGNRHHPSLTGLPSRQTLGPININEGLC